MSNGACDVDVNLEEMLSFLGFTGLGGTGAGMIGAGAGWGFALSARGGGASLGA